MCVHPQDTCTGPFRALPSQNAHSPPAHPLLSHICRPPAFPKLPEVTLPRAPIPQQPPWEALEALQEEGVRVIQLTAPRHCPSQQNLLLSLAFARGRLPLRAPGACRPRMGRIASGPAFRHCRVVTRTPPGTGEPRARLLHCWWECKLVQPLWRTVWRFLKKLETSSREEGHL